MIPKVSISQFGNRYKIYVNGANTSFEKLLTMCNCDPVKLRRILRTEGRERGVVESILKAENSVSFSSTTYWKEGVPMWVPLVASTAGVRRNTAAYRIKQWLNGGSYERMLRHKYLQRVM